MVTNQKLLWKQGSLKDDGRMFDSSLLDQTDEAKLVKEVKKARMTLIEQVHFSILLPKTAPHPLPPVALSLHASVLTGC